MSNILARYAVSKVKGIGYALPYILPGIGLTAPVLIPVIVMLRSAIPNPSGQGDLCRHRKGVICPLGNQPLRIPRQHFAR